MSPPRLLAIVALAVGCSDAGRRGNGEDSGLNPGASGATGTGPSASSGAESGAADGSTGARLDVGAGTGAGMPGDVETGFLWAANSPEGTVSKIDTVTGVEMGRYVTGPMAAPDPSRTSVNLLGDVAVANRGGGVAKIAGLEERCVDRNGDGEITTSTGPADVLAFSTDECLLWHTALPASADKGPRPVAWEAALDPDGEPGAHPRVWVGYYQESGDAIVVRIDGDTGDILDTVTVPGFSDRSLGPYGGAADPDDNFWIVGFHDVGLVRIDAVSLAVDTFPTPFEEFYGLALDVLGNPWIGALDGHVYHYDVASGSWVDVGVTGGPLRGLAVDEHSRAFVAGNGACRLVEVDTATRTVTNAAIELPDCSIPVGVSIDFEGFVWVVDNGGWAYKVDPDSYAVITVVEGLTGPYTYSDMTGSGLRLVSSPPAG